MPISSGKSTRAAHTAAMATLVLHVAGGAALRLLLVAGGAGEALMQRIEIGTPVTSLLRLREGLFLQTLGLSPYAGTARSR